jgi:hypothetical protein
MTTSQTRSEVALLGVDPAMFRDDSIDLVEPVVENLHAQRPR